MTAARGLVAALALILTTLSCGAAEPESEALKLGLPTDNDALFRGGGAEFYQHIERDYLGVIRKPWQGGQYGFVRNPVQTTEGMIYTRFHEGIDIRPQRRDARGEPLDEVRAIAPGIVVYTNAVPSFSNYGNYVVIEHHWGNSPYYSLYGHLRSISTRTGERVIRGDAIGVMGYTGEGLNQERAHVHLELNLMLSRDFDSWYAKFFPADPNHHSNYNGLNLTGIDIARLYLELRKNPSLTIPQFLAREETFYRVQIPASKPLFLTTAYPWLISSKEEDAKSWEVSFNAAGVPVKIAPGNTSVSEPRLIYFKSRAIEYSYLTRGVIGGHGATAALTDSGKRLMRLLTWPD